MNQPTAVSGDVSAKALPGIVNAIIELGQTDDEAAHTQEDRLRLAVIRVFCPPDVIAEIDRLEDAEFARWSA